MKTISLYDPKTGLFTGEMKRGPDLEHLMQHVPLELAAVEGEVDHRSSRIDLQTGEVVHDPAMAQANRARVATESARDTALQQIAALELRQARPLRELARDPRNGTARLKIDEIDIEIARLREQLKD